MEEVGKDRAGSGHRARCLFQNIPRGLESWAAVVPFPSTCGELESTLDLESKRRWAYDGERKGPMIPRSSPGWDLGSPLSCGHGEGGGVWPRRKGVHSKAGEQPG